MKNAKKKLKNLKTHSMKIAFFGVFDMFLKNFYLSK